MGALLKCVVRALAHASRMRTVRVVRLSRMSELDAWTISSDTPMRMGSNSMVPDRHSTCRSFGGRTVISGMQLEVASEVMCDPW